MKVLREETHADGALTLQVIQEHEGAGLNWRYVAKHPLLGDRTQTSSGRFYTDQHGEKIHGATVDDVADHAMACVRSLFPWLQQREA